VLVAAVDSLLNASTLKHYESENRLLSEENSDGFIPGEGAGALLIRVADVRSEGLVCTGIGFGNESASIDSGMPLRAEGLTNAIRAALGDAGCAMHRFDFRIADISGEQYYFKEAAISLSRTLRQRKQEFDLWHPAECMGEAGAALGVAIVALADASCRKGYSRGHFILAHMANDSGYRAALSFQFRARQ
jgi:3-oxoacyl-[acyl-carrier-protein] synthase-1